jgi:hypothetical protein
LVLRPTTADSKTAVRFEEISNVHKIMIALNESAEAKRALPSGVEQARKLEAAYTR